MTFLPMVGTYLNDYWSRACTLHVLHGPTRIPVSDTCAHAHSASMSDTTKFNHHTPIIRKQSRMHKTWPEAPGLSICYKLTTYGFCLPYVHTVPRRKLLRTLIYAARMQKVRLGYAGKIFDALCTWGLTHLIAHFKWTTEWSSVSQALLAIHFRYPLPLRYRSHVHSNQPFPVNQALKYTDLQLIPTSNY